MKTSQWFKICDWWNQFTPEKKRELASMHGYDYEDMWDVEIASLYYTCLREERANT